MHVRLLDRLEYKVENTIVYGTQSRKVQPKDLDIKAWKKVVLMVLVHMHGKITESFALLQKWEWRNDVETESAKY